MGTEKIGLTPEVVVQIVEKSGELGGVELARAATLTLSEILHRDAQLGGTLISHSFDVFTDAIGRNAD